MNEEALGADRVPRASDVCGVAQRYADFTRPHDVRVAGVGSEVLETREALRYRTAPGPL